MKTIRLVTSDQRFVGFASVEPDQDGFLPEVVTLKDATERTFVVFESISYPPPTYKESTFNWASDFRLHPSPSPRAAK